MVNKGKKNNPKQKSLSIAKVQSDFSESFIGLNDLSLELLTSEDKLKETKKDKKGKKSQKPQKDVKESRKTASQKKAEELRLKEEQVKKEAIEKERIAAMKLKAKLKKEQLAREANEFEIRNDLLVKSCKLLNDLLLSKNHRDAAARKEEEWERYTKCEGIPNPSSVLEMNYYFYDWKMQADPVSLEGALSKFEQVLFLIETLNNYVLQPIDATKSAIDLWKFMRRQLYAELFNKLDKLTFNMMLNVRKTLEPISPMAGRVEKQTHSFAMALYSRFYDLRPCIGETDEDDIQLPIVIEFPLTEVSIYVPYQIMYNDYVVRLIWSKFDDFSILTSTYDPMPIPDEYLINIYQYNMMQYEERQRIISEYEEEVKNRRLKRKMKSISKSKQNEELILKNPPVETETPAEAEAEAPTEPAQSLDGDWDDISKSSIVSDSEMSLQQETEPRTDLKSHAIKPPSVTILLLEEERKKTLKKYLKENVIGGSVLNLRKYRVIGGIIHVDFFESLPQPLLLQDATVVQVLTNNCQLKRIPINVNTTYVIKPVYNKYRERIACVKAEMTELEKGEEDDDKPAIAMPADVKYSTDQSKRQGPTSQRASKASTRKSSTRAMSSSKFGLSSKMEEEEEECLEEEEVVSDDDSYKSHDSTFDEFILKQYEPCNFKPKIKLTLPKHVLWFEKPIPVIWNDRKMEWYHNDKRLLFDVEYQENKDGVVESVSFRYSKIEAPLALAVMRYSCLPFTNWELYPDFSSLPKEFVIFHIETEFISLYIKLGASVASLASVDIRLPRQDKHIIDDLVGKLYNPSKLVQKLRRVGINITPDHDTYLYMTNRSPKNYVCENHTYQIMALACTTYKFFWSKWNHLTSSNSLVMYLMECIQCQVKMAHHLCLINPKRAVLMPNDENSEELNELFKSTKYYPDLYWLIQELSCTTTKMKMNTSDKLLIDTVIYMLQSTKIFSYS